MTGSTAGSTTAAVSTANTVVATDLGPLSSTLAPASVLFPNDTAASQRAVIRDCGLSSALPNGKSLWVFCDTAVFDNIAGTGTDRTAKMRFVPSGTAGLATSTTDPTTAAPIEIHEATYPSMATPYIVSSRQFGAADDRQPIACTSGAPSFAWTAGMVALPGTQTVVSFFQDHCVNADASYPEYDIGVAELNVAATGPGDFSGADQLRVDQRFDSVLVNPEPGSTKKWGYGLGPTVAGEFLYTYSATPAQITCANGECRQYAPGSVHVARVRWANGEYRSGQNYEYYTGSNGVGWSHDPSAAADLIADQRWPSGDGLSVAWYPQLQRYVMSHANSTFIPTNGVALRTSATPWGPWSSATLASIDATSSGANPTGGCRPPTGCRTFVLHSELTPAGGAQLYVSYVRNNDLADANGQIVTFNGAPSMQVRLASVALSALPVAPPETELLSYPTNPSPSATSTFTFGTASRPVTVGETITPDPASVATAATYRCAVDGSAAVPCASPFSVPTLAPGSHTFAVQAITVDGRVDPTPATWTWSVDTEAPTTAIVTAPAAQADPDNSSFEFAGTDDQTAAADVAFECSLNSSAFRPCAARTTFTEVHTGRQSLAVRAVDHAGNVDPTPETWEWGVDMDPVVTFATTPARFTVVSSARFTFTVSDDLTAVELLAPTCALDGADAEPCDAAWSADEVAEGPHTLVVTTTDGSSNIGTGAFTWTVDTNAPTAFVETDAPLTNRPTATIAFGGTDAQTPAPQLTFECSLDGAPFVTCSSPMTVTELDAGDHQVVVRSTDQTGHVSAAAAASWSIDLGIPSLAFAFTPAAVTTTDAVAYVLAGNDDLTPAEDLVLECALDREAFTACSSTIAYSGLVPGAHTFSARATDAAGNTSAVLVQTWTVDIAAITGTVRDQFTGNGIAGVRVQVFHSTGIIVSTTMTAADGSYRISHQPSGAYRLSYYDPTGAHVMQYSVGMATLPTATPVPVVSGSTLVLDASLEPRTTMSGRVTDRATGQTMAGVWVTLFNGARAPIALAITGTDGSYRFANLVSGSYHLGFSDRSGNHVVAYWNAKGEVATVAEATTIIATGAPVAAHASLEPLTLITGVVTDKRTRLPVAGVWVSLIGANGSNLALAITAANGSYRFPTLRMGSYRLSFSDRTGTYVSAHWAPMTPAVSLAGAASIQTVGGTVVADVALGAYTTLTGTILDQRTGKGVGGIYVLILPADRLAILAYTWTLPDGTFSLPPMVPGDYKILVLDLAHLQGSPSHYISQWYGGGFSLDDFGTATTVHASGGRVVLDTVSLGHT